MSLHGFECVIGLCTCIRLVDIYETCVHIVEQTVIKKPEKNINIDFYGGFNFFYFQFKKKIKIEINIETEKQTANRI